MIKCPNCGSTAQVKAVGVVCGETIVIRKFSCGCGCEFLRYYNLHKDLCKVITKEGEKRK